jgi:hypothetical protein
MVASHLGYQPRLNGSARIASGREDAQGAFHFYGCFSVVDRFQRLKRLRIGHRKFVIGHFVQKVNVALTRQFSIERSEKLNRFFTNKSHPKM